MIIQLKQVFDEAARARLIADMNTAPMLDGRSSAGPLGQDLKATYQVDSRAPVYAEMTRRVLNALQQHSAFKQRAVPRRILPPLFARYGKGCFYKRHVDNALMGPFPALRSDMSITLFLNGPEDYDGGALCIETPMGEMEYRLAAGDAVLYPTEYPHWVTEVTRGERLAVITWVESLVKDPRQRGVLADLAELMEWAVAEQIDQEALLKIEKTRLNLTKMWAQT